MGYPKSERSGMVTFSAKELYLFDTHTYTYTYIDCNQDGGTF